jgi:hypothetical protein
MSEQPSPAEAPASAAETELERKLAEQRARLAAVPPWPGLLAACIVPVGTVIAFVLLGSELAESEKELERIQAGGLIGVGLGWVLAFLLALWVVRASGPRRRARPSCSPWRWASWPSSSCSASAPCSSPSLSLGSAIMRPMRSALRRSRLAFSSCFRPSTAPRGNGCCAPERCGSGFASPPERAVIRSSRDHPKKGG